MESKSLLPCFFFFAFPPCAATSLSQGCVPIVFFFFFFGARGLGSGPGPRMEVANLKLCCRSPTDVSKRLDELIQDIRARFHGPAIGKSRKEVEPHDVLIVAHGHILRAFAARWIGKDVSENPALILEAGGVGTLR